MGKLKGSTLILTAGILLYIAALFLQPIYQRLWLQFITLNFPLITLKFLGYIMVGIAIACGLGFAITATQKKRRPIRQSILLLAIIIFLIAAMPLVWPEWFFSYWSF